MSIKNTRDNVRLKINIASYGGRNWLLDLARELEKNGHEVNFYSYLPTNRALKFGLKKECNRSYFILALPFLALLKFTHRANWALFLFHFCFDHFTAYYSGFCDVFIGQSPMHVYSLDYARKKYGATIILERGTSHVLEQIKALRQNPALKGKNPMPNMFLKRDLKGYELADYITVPSDVVRQSFILHSFSSARLFVNPFGVNLSQFKPTVLTKNNPFDLISVGQWCHRKGCDLLIEVCRKYRFTLLHVGSIVDIPFPLDENMKHIDSVEESSLINYYRMAKVFVLPSREEGLALVQPQALVCGLPIVCSKYTGGRDLKPYITDPKWILEMEEYSIGELVKCIYKALDLSKEQLGERSYSVGLESNLSWDAYGKRYNGFLKSISKI